ncbi:MAG: trypsin-like peptidase domain-containing protein [Firmicutes bacterium]|nr:trypsin-like peptidase domain-containing protein [Bacillota bacterium]
MSNSPEAPETPQEPDEAAEELKEAAEAVEEAAPVAAEEAAPGAPNEAAGANEAAEPAEEWVAEPSLSQPAYAAYGRPDGYNNGSGHNGYRPNGGYKADAAPARPRDDSWNSDWNAPSGAKDAANAPRYAGGTATGAAAAGTAAGAAGRTAAGATVAQRPAARPSYPTTPPPAQPKAAAKPERKKRSLWWPIMLICLSLLAGYLGARLQTRSITAKVTDEITNDIQAYMEETGATVLYRSVNTQTASGDEAIDVASVSDLAADSVVEIATEIVSNDFYSWFYSGSNVRQGAGSGVILSEDGYILTCYHVIKNANTITVATREGQTFDAAVVGGDEEEDIAIIKVEAEGLTPAVMGDSDELRVGSPVVAIGNPLGQLGGTVTAGIISSLERQVTIDDQTFTVMQTDAAINSGNSGGGLFNAKGELIGLVDAKAADIGVEGLAFALPLNSIKDYIEDIVAHGEVVSRVTLGVQLLDATDQRTALSYRLDELGVYILSVQDNSNAAYAGLKAGDRIVSIDGAEVESAQQVIDIINSKQVGDTLEMVIVRDGEEQQLSVILYGPNQDPANIQQT